MEEVSIYELCVAAQWWLKTVGGGRPENSVTPRCAHKFCNLLKIAMGLTQLTTGIISFVALSRLGEEFLTTTKLVIEVECGRYALTLGSATILLVVPYPR